MAPEFPKTVRDEVAGALGLHLAVTHKLDLDDAQLEALAKAGLDILLDWWAKELFGQQPPKTRQFTAGFALACAILADAHGEDSYAYMLMDDAGITPADLTILEKDDAKILRKVFADNAPKGA